MPHLKAPSVQHSVVFKNNPDSLDDLCFWKFTLGARWLIFQQKVNFWWDILFLKIFLWQKSKCRLKHSISISLRAFSWTCRHGTAPRGGWGLSLRAGPRLSWMALVGEHHGRDVTAVPQPCSLSPGEKRGRGTPWTTRLSSCSLALSCLARGDISVLIFHADLRLKHSVLDRVPGRKPEGCFCSISFWKNLKTSF